MVGFPFQDDSGHSGRMHWEERWLGVVLVVQTGHRTTLGVPLSSL